MQSGGGAIGGSFSPSFNAYSSSDCSLAQIAGRVVNEFRHELEDAQLEEIDDVYNNHHDNDDDSQFPPLWLEQESPIPRNDAVKETAAAEDEEKEEEVEFEFACVTGDAAEEALSNGQIRPVYPVFDQTLLNDDVDRNSAAEEVAKTPPRRRRQQLRMLMLEEERAAAASCSSSEADDLENLPPGT